MNDLISNLKSKNTDLKNAEIEGILYILSNKKSLENNELIRLTGISKPTIKRFKVSISNLLENPEGDKLELNNLGEDTLAAANLNPYKWTLVEHELYDYEKRIVEIRKKYNLDPKREYDQFFATPKSTVAKAKMLIDKGMVKDSEIVLIGDDDLVSVALSIMSPNYKKIKVLDIDRRILDIIEKIKDEYKYHKIETQTYDARKDLGKENLHSYDVVLIDPPYTQSGVQLFLHRSIELLKPFKAYDGNYIFMNYGAGRKSPDKTAKIQSIINIFGLVIEDKVDKYTRYFGAETVGSTSSLYVLKTTPFTRVDSSILNNEIYTFENTSEERFPYVDHYVFKISKIPTRLVSSKKMLQKIAGEFCNKHKLKVVDAKVTKFKGGGITFTFVLATSNLLIHSWPEHSALHIDLITCEPIYKRETLGLTWSNLLHTKHVEIRRVE